MWKCPKCGLELEDNVLTCPCGEPRPEEEIKEEAPVEVATVEETPVEVAPVEVAPCCCEGEDGEIIEEIGEDDFVDFEKKSTNKKLVVLISLVVLIMILTVWIFAYHLINRNVKATGQDNIITYADINKACDSIFSDDIAIKVNDVEVSKSVFKFFVNAIALDYQANQTYDDNYEVDVTKLDNFNWNSIANSETNETHKEMVLANAVTSCVQFYELISVGDKYGIELSDEDKKDIKDSVLSIKEAYGDDLDEALEIHGYDSLKQYETVYAIQLRANKVYEDISSNLSKYITKGMSAFNFQDADDVLYYIDKTSKIRINKDLIEDFEIDVDYKKVYEANAMAAADAEEEAEAEATDDEE